MNVSGFCGGAIAAWVCEYIAIPFQVGSVSVLVRATSATWVVLKVWRVDGVGYAKVDCEAVPCGSFPIGQGDTGGV